MGSEGDVAQFVSITGASRGQALRFLDATGGDLPQAIEKFYAERPTAGAAAGPSAPAGGGKKPAGGGGSRGNVRGFAELNQDEDEESEEDDHNDYYVGGEKSGQIVKGAPKDDKKGNAVEDLFENARRAGATEGRPADLHPDSRGFQAFGGRARTLAGGESSPPLPEAAPEAQEQARTIAFYANGIFTVDNGEPRRMDDPANMQFMTAISRGQLPPELDPGDPNIHVAVNLVRRDEDYTPPAQPRFTAFGGAGRKLTDDASGASTSAAAAAAGGPTLAEAVAVVAGSVSWPGADPGKPKTSIQLRLADSSRLVAEFNLDHTVGDIRAFIRAARPGGPTAFSLMTAFPSQKLEDDGATIQGAGLANSVVLQKL